MCVDVYVRVCVGACVCVRVCGEREYMGGHMCGDKRGREIWYVEMQKIRESVCVYVRERERRRGKLRATLK